MTSLEINVNGTGTTVHPAERAILSLQAHSVPVESEAKASAVVTATANKLREILLPYCPQNEPSGQTPPDAAISHYSMSTLDTTARTRRDKDTNEPIQEYSARAVFKIKFHDFAVLNKLATTFSAMENVQISSIDWCLTDRTLDSIKGGTRKLAAQEAIQKAYDYAEVFAGVPEEELKKKVKPISINEGNYYSQSTRPQLHYGKGQRGAIGRETKTNAEELQFEPEDVKLEVTVSAKFMVQLR